MTVLLVVAKAPVAGLAKTRLCPPATPEKAARVAAGALLDTLAAVRATTDVAPALAYAGEFAAAEQAGEIQAALAGWTLLRQRGDGFGERLARAHHEAGARWPGQPVLQIGMDTPQVTPELLAAAAHRLSTVDAVLGPAQDGGWWALGLRDPHHAAVLRDVPMSTADTGRLTRLALTGRGLTVEDLPVLSDVDTWADALSVAATVPHGRFAAAVWEGAHREESVWLVGTDGWRARMPVSRWRGGPEPAVREVLERCTGPTLDVGCGPGRLTAALAARGVASLGIDTSARAVAQALRRGGSALRRDVFAPVPGEGRWAHVLLVDGNIGIGGDPVRLLRRCAALLRPGGTVLAEVEPGATGLWQGYAHLAYGHRAHRTPPFRWARLGVAAVHRLAATAGLTVRSLLHRERRWFAELERP
jgi:rSAM/selenodomain-associated transferase 1